MFAKIKNLFREKPQDTLPKELQEYLTKRMMEAYKATDPQEDVEDMTRVMYKKRRKITDSNAVLNDKQIEKLHKWYFHTDEMDRLKAIKQTKQIRHKRGTQTWYVERTVDGSVRDYVIGWARVDHIAKRWEINIAEVYRNVRFIASMVDNAATK